MGAAIFRLIPLAAGITAYACWVFALIHHDPEEKHCDGDCESCPFPTERCREKDKKEDKNR